MKVQRVNSFRFVGLGQQSPRPQACPCVSPESGDEPPRPLRPQQGVKSIRQTAGHLQTSRVVADL